MSNYKSPKEISEKGNSEARVRRRRCEVREGRAKRGEDRKWEEREGGGGEERRGRERGREILMLFL